MLEYFSLKNYDFDTLMKMAMPIGPGGFDDEIPQPDQPIPQQPAPIVPNNPAPVQPQVQQPQQPAQNPQDQKPVGNKTIEFVEEKKWGQWSTIIVSIQQLTPQEKSALDRLANTYIEEHKLPNGQYPQWATWKNKFKANRIEKAPFKLFSPVKERQGCYALATTEQDFFGRALELLRNDGFDTTAVEGFKQEAHPQEQPQGEQQPKQQVAVRLQVEVPDWNIIRLKFPRDNDVTQFIKDQRIGGRWNRDLFAWDFFLCHPEKLKELAKFMQGKGYDTQQFVKAIEDYDKAYEERKANARDPNRVVEAEDVSMNTRFFVAVKFPKNGELHAEMTEFVKFSFPSEGSIFEDMKPPYANAPAVQQQLPGQEAQPVQQQNPGQRIKASGMRIATNGKFYLYGKFDDFVRFGHLLKNSKWNIDGYRLILQKLITSKRMEKTRFTGELDGYAAIGENGKQLRDKTGNPLFDTERFYQDLDAIVTGGGLLPKQKQGVAWLYSRNSAILGDKAGTGKTLSTIASAAMRLKTSGGRCLVMVLKNTKQQWQDEIRKWLGDADGDSVSDDPSSNAKWIIMSYSSVSAIPMKDKNTGDILRLPNGAPQLAPKKQRMQILVNKLFDARFTCLILDEAHVLKNENAGVSRILGSLSSRIPFKWGATATPSANTSADMHNLLALTGHTLGEMSTRAFNKEFVGGKMNTGNMADAAVVEAQERAAYNLRKWLTLSGAYLSRSMHSMNPDLPPHTIEELNIPHGDFNMEQFLIELANKKNTYKSLASGITHLTAQRVTLANMKVPYTLQEAKNIVNNGGRVIVFSCFRGTCKAIANGLKQHLAQLDPDTDPNSMVVHIMDGDKAEGIEAAIQSFRDPESPAKAMVIASLKGGTGVSLPNSTEEVLMNDFDWTPRVTEQTEGRAYRINNVIPVRTRYMVVEDGPGLADKTPDKMFYRYVRTKIRLARIIQDLDAESEEYILKGLDDTEVQAKLNEARAEDRAANIALAQEINELMQQYGVNQGEGEADLVGGQLDLDEAWEDEQLREDKEPGEDGAVQASGWYSLLKINA